MAADPRGDVRVENVELVRAILAQIGLKLSDLDFTAIANEGMRVAAALAPRRSGKLARSIRAVTGKRQRAGLAARATIKAGSPVRVPYAGAINYGWRKRNIEPSHFMQRASDIMARRAPALVKDEVRRSTRELS